jgi:molybdopterin-guanine dinucleotide biosynthesis adapter protein
MKIISFVAAAANSGKTTLIEKVVRILKARGLRIAVIKHASKGFELDRPGKDSWRFSKAGADAVLLAGPGQVALLRSADRDPSPAELAALVGDMDLVIIEGFKRESANRIEVFRHGVSGPEPLCLRDRSILALVSDRPIDAGIPWMALDDAEGVADCISAGIKG